MQILSTDDGDSNNGRGGSGKAVILEESKRGHMMHLKLYVVKQSKRGILAIRDFKALIESESLEDHEYEIIDVFEDPSEVERDRIMATPTLLRESPRPRKRLMGDLTDIDTIKLLLDL